MSNCALFNDYKLLTIKHLQSIKIGFENAIVSKKPKLQASTDCDRLPFSEWLYFKQNTA